MQHHVNTGIYNRVQSQKKADQYCNEIYKSVPFQHTDRDGFFHMVEESADFAFVTARHEIVKAFTHDNLRSIDIDPEIHKVHFCGNVAKGEYIIRNFDLAKYDHVVFIDDQVPNLENVLLRLNHKDLQLYHFKRDKTDQPVDYYPLPPGFNPMLRFDGDDIVKNEQADSDPL